MYVMLKETSKQTKKQYERVNKARADNRNARIYKRQGHGYPPFPSRGCCKRRLKVERKVDEWKIYIAPKPRYVRRSKPICEAKWIFPSILLGWVRSVSLGLVIINVGSLVRVIPVCEGYLVSQGV